MSETSTNDASTNDAHPVFSYIPSLMAVADDPKYDDPKEDAPRREAPNNEDSWLEKRQRNPKRLGERSQAEFLLKAHTLGMSIAVPWGDSEKYDFIVSADPSRRLFRVCGIV